LWNLPENKENCLTIAFFSISSPTVKMQVNQYYSIAGSRIIKMERKKITQGNIMSAWLENLNMIEPL
jgi:hypothetical protein